MSRGQLLPSASRKSGAHDDAIRDERLGRLREVVEGFTFNIATLVAGCEADLEAYADTSVALRVRSTLSPFLQGSERIRPDFGPYGELRIAGDLLDDDGSVTALLRFEDRSFRETDDGRLRPSPRRRVTFEMAIPLRRMTVASLSVSTNG